MRVRHWAVILLAGGTALIAGCPLGFDLGLGGYGVIPDGTYAGDVDATVEFREDGEVSSEESEVVQTWAKFADGALLKDSGGEFQIGDVDFLEDGAYEITREVYSIDMGSWGYEIAFDLTGEWDSIRMTGWEIATYTLNADGSVELFDEIELTSEDGGALTIHSDSYATLAADQAWEPTPEQTPRDILDLKSGKIRR